MRATSQRSLPCNLQYLSPAHPLHDASRAGASVGKKQQGGRALLPVAKRETGRSARPTFGCGSAVLRKQRRGSFLARHLQGSWAMRIAVPTWRDRVSPVFDVAGTLLLVDVEAELESQRNDAQLTDLDPVARVRKLRELGVDVLICAAISQSLEELLTAAGITVMSRTCGDVDEVLQAFQTGRLHEQRFAMPGCCVENRVRRRGCRRRRGRFRE